MIHVDASPQLAPGSLIHLPRIATIIGHSRRGENQPDEARNGWRKEGGAGTPGRSWRSSRSWRGYVLAKLCSHRFVDSHLVYFRLGLLPESRTRGYVISQVARVRERRCRFVYQVHNGLLCVRLSGRRDETKRCLVYSSSCLLLEMYFSMEIQCEGGEEHAEYKYVHQGHLRGELGPGI